MTEERKDNRSTGETGNKAKKRETPTKLASKEYLRELRELGKLNLDPPEHFMKTPCDI